jgi:hypothetical protein
MKKNNDGSSRLGTLQTSKLIALVNAQNTAIQTQITANEKQFTDGLITDEQYASQDTILKSKLINVSAITEAQTAVETAVATLSALIKAQLDNRINILIMPDELESEENHKVPFVFDTYVSYPKRKNPTRSASVKQAAADALALKLANERNAKKAELKAALASVEYASPEYAKILDEIISM